MLPLALGDSTAALIKPVREGRRVQREADRRLGRHDSAAITGVVHNRVQGWGDLKFELGHELVGTWNRTKENGRP